MDSSSWSRGCRISPPRRRRVRLRSCAAARAPRRCSGVRSASRGRRTTPAASSSKRSVPGTRLLSELQPGDPLDTLGPLGHGFSVVDAGSVVCVSGGLGCAPFPLLINELRRRGVEDILVLNGARTATRLYPAERFARPAVPVVAEATDDGTRGHHGPVTDLLRQALSSHPSALYACGPNPMLGAVMRRPGRVGSRICRRRSRHRSRLRWAAGSAPVSDARCRCLARTGARSGGSAAPTVR